MKTIIIAVSILSLSPITSQSKDIPSENYKIIYANCMKEVKNFVGVNASQIKELTPDGQLGLMMGYHASCYREGMLESCLFLNGSVKNNDLLDIIIDPKTLSDCTNSGVKEYGNLSITEDKEEPSKLKDDGSVTI